LWLRRKACQKQTCQATRDTRRKKNQWHKSEGSSCLSTDTQIHTHTWQQEFCNFVTAWVSFSYYVCVLACLWEPPIFCAPIAILGWVTVI
jgi:hypothetical protein